MKTHAANAKSSRRWWITSRARLSTCNARMLRDQPSWTVALMYHSRVAGSGTRSNSRQLWKPRDSCSSLLHEFPLRPRRGERAHVLEIAR